MYFYDKYGLLILFWLSVIVIVGLLIYNLFYGSKGTYTDHSRLIWSLLNSNNTTKQRAKESSGERECRRIAEKLTGYAFPKQRPSFLKNVITDSKLELDCYCSQLNVAIEYNGRQHYDYTPHFHSSKDAYYNTRYRDDMKSRLCKENGVNLIIVPYTVPINKIESYLYDKFKEMKII